MKIAVAGKGGVGKTTVAGVLAHLYAKNGFDVLAIDNDASMNLAYALGVPEEQRNQIVPISRMSELIEERTSVAGVESGIYNVNPTVSDIPDKFKITGPNNIQLLALGTIEEPSTGCFCPGNALVRSLLYELLVKRNEVIIVDFEAGLEHLGRGTARGVDLIIIVAEPSKKSIDLSKKIADLASKLNIKKIGVLFNKVQNDAQLAVLNSMIGESLVLLGHLPVDDAVVQADLLGESLFLSRPNSVTVKELEEVWQKIHSLLQDS